MNEIPKSCWPEWEIVEKIGSGSFGEVYKICRVDESKEYFDALKIIRIPKEYSEVETLQSSGIHDVDAYYEKYVENIFNEIDTMIQLGGNTNIVDYKDHKKIKRKNEVGYDIYIRMELLTSLLEYRKHHTMSQDEILQMGIDICKALELCEKRNIVHRDIKPENIFINKYGDYKLGDFGISRSLYASTVGTMAGTVNYMAPEIYKHEKFDGRVDIYSLGLVLYNFLNKGLPFMPSLPGEAMARRMKGEPIPPIQGVSKAINDVICKACSYHAKDRYPDAFSFRKALESVKKGVKTPIIPKEAQSETTMIVNTNGQWTCSCGQANHGKFCTACGKERQESTELSKIILSSQQDNGTVKKKKNYVPIVFVALFLLCLFGAFFILRANLDHKEKTVDVQKEVLRSGDQTFTSVQDFIDHGTEQEATLLQDVEENVEITRPVTIDLNGHTIINDQDKPTIYVKETCSLSNGTIDSEFEHPVSTIKVEQGATLNLDGVNVNHDTTVMETIELNGTLNAGGSRLFNPSCNVICTYEGKGSAIHLYNGTTVEGQSTYDAITNHGSCVIDDATIRAYEGYALDNWNQCSINTGAQFISTSNDKAAILNETSGILQINGGDYSSYNKVIYNQGILQLSTSSLSKSDIKNEGVLQ